MHSVSQRRDRHGRKELRHLSPSWGADQLPGGAQATWFTPRAQLIHCLTARRGMLVTLLKNEEEAQVYLHFGKKQAPHMVHSLRTPSLLILPFNKGAPWELPLKSRTSPEQSLYL